MRSTFHRFLLLAFASGSLLVSAAAGPALSSRWLDRTITIDGRNDEWEDALVPIENTLVSLGAFNDGRFLYLCLTADEPRVRAQILRSGLVVWFDGRGGTKKAFGIKYPVGELPMLPTDRRQGGRPARPSAANPAGEEPPNRVELLGSKDEDARTLLLDRVPGIELRLGRTTEVESDADPGVPGYEVPRYGRPPDPFGRVGLIYELKIPLQANAELPFAVGAAPGATIGLGIETLKPQNGDGPPGMRRGLGMQGPGGMGRGGQGGPGGPGGRGGRGGLRGEALKPIKFWATMRLALN